MHGTHKKFKHGPRYGHCGPGMMGFKHMKGGPYGFFGPEVVHGFLSKLQNWMPYDLAETDEDYIVTMALPGYEVKDIEVSVKGNSILIEAKKEITKEEDPKVRKLVSLGDFIWNRPNITVKIPVDNEIDPEHVKAKLSKGILNITFKKIPGKKVDIESEE